MTNIRYGLFPIYYNITIGGEGSSGTPNLYYVINGRPFIGLVITRKSPRGTKFCSTPWFTWLLGLDIGEIEGLFFILNGFNNLPLNSRTKSIRVFPWEVVFSYLKRQLFTKHSCLSYKTAETILASTTPLQYWSILPFFLSGNPDF